MQQSFLISTCFFSLQRNRELERITHIECGGHGTLHWTPKAVSAKPAYLDITMYYLTKTNVSDMEMS